MREPWNLKKDDERIADSLPNFIIFCEDGEIEPEYFNCFTTGKIKISPIRNCKQHHQQVDYATDYLRENDLIEFKDGREQLKLDEGAQVWCVFDRDKADEDGKNTSFNDSIATAELKGIKVAWSNDDFELWVLLHFEDIDVNNPDYKYRWKYYERLTFILSQITPLNAEEEKVTRHPRFSYSEGMKRRNRFIQITFQHMKGKTDIAIERSKRLEAFHNQVPKPLHEKAPCTMVHYLVLEIIRFGGRQF
jgi:hypothetical protein